MAERETNVPASQDAHLQDSGFDTVTGSETGATQTTSFSVSQLERTRDLLGRFYGARRAVRFYPAGHPAIEESVGGLMDVISAYHKEGVDIPLTFFEDELMIGQSMLPEDSMLFDQLIRDMTAIGAGSVTLERGLDTQELLRAVQVLAVDSAEAEEAGGLAKLIERANLTYVRIGAVKVLDRPPNRIDDDSAREVYGSAVDLLRDLEMALRTAHSLPTRQTQAVVRSLVDNVLQNRFAMLELAGLKDYDEYTFYHSVNVAILSLALGSVVTEEKRFLNALGAGALMHDVGKMTVEGEILNKPGTLDAAEWAKMRLHPVHGAELAATMAGMDKASVVVILEHHMRYDGKGYPATPIQTGQHLASRIVAVADAFDAMTSRRSYSAARLPDAAMGVLVDNVGTSFDPALVRRFVRLMGVYPPRSVVRLSSGEIALVLRPGKTDLTLPAVRVISGPDGATIEPYDMDLSDSGASESISVEACLDPRGLNVDPDDYL